MLSRTSRRFASVLGLAALTAACDAEDTPLAPDAARPDAAAAARSQAARPGLDGVFARLGAAVPGFGGFSFDPAGDAVVYLTDMRHQAAARAAVEPILRAGRWTVGTAQNRRAPTGKMVFRRGDFSFVDMADWADRLAGDVLRVDGVVFVDVDESSNRVVVGTEARVPRGRIVSAAARAGIPPRAVEVVQVPKLELTSHNLQHDFRPVPGGVRTERSNGNFCTVGFNAMRNTFGDSNRYFVTNGHCTGFLAQLENEPFYQPTVAFGNFVGTERFDPPSFQGGSCPPDFQCRWSDAALVRYEGSIGDQFGYIARPYYGSIDIDPANPRFRIDQEVSYPADNSIVDKVGQTTGWTYGYVRHTCIRTEYPVLYFPPMMLLCQDYADYSSAQGDSGGPVFIWQEFSYTDASLLGIHWGRGEAGVEPGVNYAIFSSMSNIEIDLGDLLVTAP